MMYQQSSRPPPQPVPTYPQLAQPQQPAAPSIAQQRPPGLVQQQQHQQQHRQQHQQQYQQQYQQQHQQQYQPQPQQQQPIHVPGTHNPRVVSAEITPRQQHQQVQQPTYPLQLPSAAATPRLLARQQYYAQASAAVAGTSQAQRQPQPGNDQRSNSGHAGSASASIAPFALGSPALAAVLRAQPGTIIRQPIILSSPGLARMSFGNNMRPMFIAAGPPSIIQNPSRTKLLLERPVPHIHNKQRTHTLLADFWDADLDVSREGKVVMMSARSKGSSEWRKKTPKQTGIVVGIDFGNTFTGVSYAHQNDGEMIDIVKWPKHLNAYSKVPSVSLYKTNDDKSLVEWGSSALASYKRSRTDRVLIRNYKLQLFDQGARGRLEHGLHLTDAFTQYIHSVHRYLIEEVNKTQVLSAASVPIHYCITIPQAWTLPTRELILRCYVEAGIILQTPAPNMTVITEAEAAATYCREHCVEFESLKDGDVFMVCDAGGLTTHVTAFRVDDALGVRQFMRLSSLHAEDCGSVILDRNFKNLVLLRLTGLDLDAKPQRQKAFETLLEGFEEIKFQFDPNSIDEVKHILVPMGLDVSELRPTPSWMEDEYMSLSGRELCEVVFDPVVKKVRGLVCEQSKAHPVCACLFLVGGFGANKYLHHQFLQSQLEAEEARMAGHGSDGVIQKVVMVQKAELAVARGAVIYGLKSAAQQSKAFL